MVQSVSIFTHDTALYDVLSWLYKLDERLSIVNDLRNCIPLLVSNGVRRGHTSHHRQRKQQDAHGDHDPDAHEDKVRRARR